MKLSSETLEILNDFSRINMSILMREGNKLRTVSPQKNVMAVAKISETIPKEVAVYDLRQLLSTMSLFQDPDVSFGEKKLKITNGSGAVASYSYSAKETIVAAPEKDINLPSQEISFSLKSNVLEGVLKAASVLSLPEIAVIGRKGKIYISALKSKDDSAHNWEMEVGETDKMYTMVFLVDSLKLLKRDYDVVISSKGIAKFTSQTGDVTYYISTETSSKYE